ncbi:hypothetical protein A3K63_04345 [Candidatus Micrarchaeota archaeon RBG_16_49_10]|nr:MAG: hypothetical protein A3K63_04345 [Candidatus Micrarchaeota archaeon RBG_16_49_10]
MDLIAMGSLIVDATIVSASIRTLGNQLYLKKGSKAEIDKLEFSLGGSAHNIAFGASRLGLKTGIIGCVGYDSFGKSIVERLRKEGVDTRLLKRAATKMTGYSTVLIGPDGDRSILVYRGANDLIDSSDITEKYFSGSRAFLFTSLTGDRSVKALQKAVRVAERKRMTIIANPSINMIAKRRDELEELVQASNIVIMNEEEALEYTKSSHLTAALDKLVVGNELVVVTLGERGSITFDGSRKYKQKAFKSRVLDATGAGDAFAAAFVRCYLKGLDIPYSLKFASSTSSLVLRSYGATNNFPSKVQIMELMES